MGKKIDHFIRNPNIPIMAWAVGTTLHEVLIAGPSEYINMAHKSHGQWSPNSIITRQYGVNGLHEVEYNLHDVGTWGWLGRYISGEVQAQLTEPVRYLMPTDTHRGSTDEGADVVGYLWGVFFDKKGIVIEPTGKWERELKLRLPPTAVFDTIKGKNFAEVEDLYWAHYQKLREAVFNKQAA
jgi:hypothetical protein